MSQVILIGGAPRVGKTMAINMLVAAHPMLAASTDAIRYVMRRLVNKQSHPDLFAESVDGFDSVRNVERMRNSPWDIVNEQNAESQAVWQSCLEFIASNLEDDQDVALEGVAILPENTVQLGPNFKTLFLINRGNQNEVIRAHARSHPNDWLHKYSDELIDAFCNFNQQQNEYFFIEAQKHRQPYIEIANDTFESDLQLAINQLFAD